MYTQAVKELEEVDLEATPLGQTIAWMNGLR
jgi:hypothetical protein